MKKLLVVGLFIIMCLSTVGCNSVKSDLDNGLNKNMDNQVFFETLSDNIENILPKYNIEGDVKLDLYYAFDNEYSIIISSSNIKNEYMKNIKDMVISLSKDIDVLLEKYNKEDVRVKIGVLDSNLGDEYEEKAWVFSYDAMVDVIIYEKGGVDNRGYLN